MFIGFAGMPCTMPITTWATSDGCALLNDVR
jgi:hypothetical protein